VDVRPGDALGTSMCLALRAAAPCKSAILPICRTLRGTHQITSLRHIRKTPLAGRLAYVAERGGFEPPKRGLDAYTLSRRAPSTTRTPLRWNLKEASGNAQGRRF